VAVQTTAVPAHVPPWQVVLLVQRLPSSHAPPSTALAKPHVPLPQVATWQVAVGCGQSFGTLQPTHWPPALQTNPAPHAVPAALFVCAGAPLAQVSVVQGLPSSAGTSALSAANPQVPDVQTAF
jgi:hypothetical protein